MRGVWELFNRNLGKCVMPSEYWSIDETLYPMQHQVAFRHYNPNKPHRYGLLCKSLNDTRFPYTYKAVPYASKPVAGNGPYYIKNAIDYVKYLVNEVSSQQSIEARTISPDSLYTTIEST